MTAGNDPAEDLYEVEPPRNSRPSSTPDTIRVDLVSTHSRAQAGSQAETSASGANQTTSSSDQSRNPREFLSPPPRTGSSKTRGSNILGPEFNDGR